MSWRKRQLEHSLVSHPSSVRHQVCHPLLSKTPLLSPHRATQLNQTRLPEHPQTRNPHHKQNMSVYSSLFSSRPMLLWQKIASQWTRLRRNPSHEIWIAGSKIIRTVFSRSWCPSAHSNHSVCLRDPVYAARSTRPWRNFCRNFLDTAGKQAHLPLISQSRKEYQQTLSRTFSELFHTSLLVSSLMYGHHTGEPSHLRLQRLYSG